MYLMIIIIFSCRSVPEKEKYSGYQISGEELGFNYGFSTRASRCLRDFIVGEMAGGVWTLIEKPIGSVLTQENLDGSDNPCIDFDLKGCGVYRIQYKVTDICCIDSTTIKINKRCCTVVGTIICK